MATTRLVLVVAAVALGMVLMVATAVPAKKFASSLPGMDAHMKIRLARDQARKNMAAAAAIIAMRQY